MHRPKIAAMLFGSPGGGSFVEAGVRAFERASTQFSADVQMHWLERVEPEWRVAQLHEVARSGPALIVLHGAQGPARSRAHG